MCVCVCVCVCVGVDVRVCVCVCVCVCIHRHVSFSGHVSPNSGSLYPVVGMLQGIGLVTLNDDPR